MRFFTFVLSLLVFASNIFAQDLLSERIRKLTSRKMSIFLSEGIFHNGQVGHSSVLKSIRQSYSEKNGYERIVFDFSTGEIPRVYGHIASSKNKIFLDLFNTKMKDKIMSLGNSKFVEHVYFYPIDLDKLSVEIVMKQQVNADIFYLANPGRLVIDVKK